MDYRHRYNTIVFVYEYLGILYLLVSAAVGRGDVAGGMLILILSFAVLYFVLRYKADHISKKEKKVQEKEKRCKIRHLVLIVILSYLWALPESMTGTGGLAGIVGTVLIYGLLVGDFCVFLYAEYYYEKYMVMYSNQCVSEETIHRFEKNTFRALKSPLTTAGIILIVLVVVAGSLWTNASVEEPAPRKRSEIQIQQTEKRDAASVRREQLRQLEEKKEESNSPFWELFVRVLTLIMQIVIIVLFVLAVLAILFFVMRKILSVRIPKFEFLMGNEDEEDDGIDEYTSLRSSAQKKSGFPEDYNGRIRRYFYRHVRKKSGGTVEMDLTPWEMADRYLRDENDVMPEGEKDVVRIYEKARYSGQACTAEDVEKMKERTGS